MVRVGDMDVQITISRWGEIKDSAGGLHVVLTSQWVLWANVKNKKGQVITDNGQMTWGYGYEFTCYYETDRKIFSNDTVDYDGQRIRINSLSIETEGNRQMLVISSSTTGEALTNNLSAVWQIINYTGTGSEGSRSHILTLINKVVKLAFKDGIEFKVIPPSGTLDDTQKQVQYDPVDGYQTWTVPFVINENALFVYADV